MASPRLQVRNTRKEHWRELSLSGSLFAVLDSCFQRSVRKKATELGAGRAISLYQGGPEACFENAAPFLFHLDTNTFDWLGESLWNTPWGILIYADAGFQALRTHLRGFLRVTGTDRQQYLFRFYDPRILRAFLTSCNDAELAQFFGPVRGFGTNAADDVTLFRLGDGVN